jgi:hypothetical protein
MGPALHEAIPFSDVQPSPDGEFWRPERVAGPVLWAMARMVGPVRQERKWVQELLRSVLKQEIP